MYNNGCTIRLVPCKVSLNSEWVKPIDISLETSTEDCNKFDRAVNNFEYYNCNAELGYYAHYYVSDKDLEAYNMCKLMCGGEK